MKKSVILIITTMSLIAIILIGLIFQRAEIYNATIYVQQIIVTHIRVGDEMYPTFWDEEMEKYRIYNTENPRAVYAFPFIPNITMDIIYNVLPIDATNQSVTFYGNPGDTIAQVDPLTGRVTFLDEGSATFTLKANDNSNKKALVFLRASIPDA